MQLFFSILILYLTGAVNTSTPPDGFLAEPILPGQVYNCCQYELYASRRDLPVIYCFPGLSKGILRIWMSVCVETQLNPEYYDLYKGYDSDDVWQQFEAQRSSWTFDWNWQQKSIDLNPFNSTCFGIRTYSDYILKVEVTDVNFSFLMLYLTGALLVYNAKSLSENTLFYYVSVIILGMSASIMVILYLIIKLIPMKKPMSLGFMAGGITVATLILQSVFVNIYSILCSYKKQLFSYIAFSGLISLVLYYRFGPITNPKSKKIIRYCLQIVGALLIVNSSYLLEAVQATIAILVIVTHIQVSYWVRPFVILSEILWLKVYNYFHRTYIIIPRRLITQFEYEQEGVVETERALEELRAYCRSPAFDRNWQLILGLQDQNKFMNFLRGDSDISIAETRQHYDTRARMDFDSLLTNDSDYEEE